MAGPVRTLIVLHPDFFDVVAHLFFFTHFFTHHMLPREAEILRTDVCLLANTSFLICWLRLMTAVFIFSDPHCVTYLDSGVRSSNASALE